MAGYEVSVSTFFFYVLQSSKVKGFLSADICINIQEIFMLL